MNIECGAKVTLHSTFKVFPLFSSDLWAIMYMNVSFGVYVLSCACSKALCNADPHSREDLFVFAAIAPSGPGPPHSQGF